MLRFFNQVAQKIHFYSILNLILRFIKAEAKVQKQALPFVSARYIRTFDVLSEVNCVLLRRRKRRFEAIELNPNFDDISEEIAFCQGGGKFSSKRLLLAN